MVQKVKIGLNSFLKIFCSLFKKKRTIQFQLSRPGQKNKRLKVFALLRALSFWLRPAWVGYLHLIKASTFVYIFF